MAWNALLICGGLLFLFIGGETLVRGSVAIAERLGLSKLLIGLTVVGVGTSAPELLVSVSAALGGAPEIALGNVVGSNIANVLLIIGLSVLICPLIGWQRSAVRDALVATLVALVLFGLVHDPLIARVEGLALLLALLVYLLASYWLERRESQTTVAEHEVEEFEDIGISRLWTAAGLVIGGIVALVLGAEWLVRGAVDIARTFSVSDAVIGLSLVAVGTSLPELATAIVAALRKHPDVVLGNVIGSNIFNVLGILGVTALITPIAASTRFENVDTPIMFFASTSLLVLLFATRRVGRGVGITMLVLYTAYIYLLFALGALE
ncbi:MAG: calcium/sodium antiporter [Pseudomonadales bacterium]